MIRYLVSLLFPRLYWPYNVRDREWRRVPPPNWASKRSGVDIW